MVCWRSTSSTIRSRRIPGSGSTTGCTETHSATRWWRRPWPGGSGHRRRRELGRSAARRTRPTPAVGTADQRCRLGRAPLRALARQGSARHPAGLGHPAETTGPPGGAEIRPHPLGLRLRGQLAAQTLRRSGEQRLADVLALANPRRYGEQRGAGVLQVLAHGVADPEPGLHRDEVGARVDDEGEEEQARRPSGRGRCCRRRSCSRGAASGRRRWRWGAPGRGARRSRSAARRPGRCSAKFGWSNSAPPDSGAPSALVRPITRSCSRSDCRSQVSMVMLIRRATR